MVCKDKNGMKSDPTGRASASRNAALCRDREEGHTYEWVAMKYGISKQRVHQIVTASRRDEQGKAEQ